MEGSISITDFQRAAGAGLRFAESSEQAAFIRWCAYFRTEHGLLKEFVFAIPNGSHLFGRKNQRAAQMARLKAEGLKPGVSDVLMAYPVAPFNGLFIEFKRRRSQFRSQKAADSAVSDDQGVFMRNMRAVGYATAVAFGCDEAIDIVTRYMQGKHR